MWPIKRRTAEELDSILYFLSSALTSVIDESHYLSQHHAALPQIGAGLATAEIASRLAMFRKQVCDVSEREFMIVTKLTRARHWAQELRRHEPHLRADIDAFLATTARCEAIGRERTSDAHSLFDGHAHPKRFLAERVPGGRVAADAALSLMERLEAAERGEIPADDAPSYLIGGEMSVDALNDACERLLARMAVHFGWEDDTGGLSAEDDLEAVDESEAVDEAEASDPDAKPDVATAEPMPDVPTEDEASAEPPAEDAPEAAVSEAATLTKDGAAKTDEAAAPPAPTAPTQQASPSASH